MKEIVNRIQNSNGNVSILMCIAMTVILAMASYVIDIGHAYIEKEKLINGIDSAALAAALELPGDRVKAEEVAKEYLIKNNIDVNNTEIIIGIDNRSIEIQAHKDVFHFFAVIFGVNQSEIYAANKVAVGPLKSAKGGLRPFAVVAFDYQYGDQVTLKEGADEGYHGNYNAVDLGGTGVAVLQSNIIYGYNGTLKIGDMIYTEPGNMVSIIGTITDVISSDSSTFQNFSRNSKRIWTIPIVDSLTLDGSKPATIVGFAQFYIEGVVNDAGHAELIGRFVRYVSNGEVDLESTDMGAYGVKLIK